MKTLLITGFFTVIAVSSFATIKVSNSQQDSTPMVKIITMDRQIIIGQLQYSTEDSIYILPGTMKDAKRGLFYKQLVLSYKDVISIRKKSHSWLSLMLIGLAGLFGLYLIITGAVPVFENGLGEANFLIWFSPVFVGGSVWQILKRKRFVVNGSKSRYEKFRLQLKK